MKLIDTKQVEQVAGGFEPLNGPPVQDPIDSSLLAWEWELLKRLLQQQR